MLPSLVIPPHIEDIPMTHSTKRPAEPPPDSPSRPVTKARPSQMPASIPPAVSPSNHLGGDVSLDFQPASSSTPQQLPQTPQIIEQQVAPGGTKKKKPDQQEEEDDDRQDPDASASGPNLPLAEPSEPEEEEEDSNETDENTTPAQTEDSDETIDYGDLYVDDSQWSWLSMEQKLCSNTGSFTVPRYIDGSRVNIKETPSHADFVTSYSVIAERKRENFRRNFSDIKEVYSGITEEDKAYLTLYQSEDKFAHLVGKKRKEATQQERRQLAKQFLEAKQAEVKSWFDNDVFELVDMRKLKIRNFVTGRWVLTVKKDKDGKFLKCKARWVLKGFQDKQKDTQQTDSPAASRSGFRCVTQFAANKGWDLYHMDLKTAFLQGEAYDESRDIICQIPPECGYPPHIGAKMKKSAYGLTKPCLVMVWSPHVLTDVHTYYILYDDAIQQKELVSIPPHHKATSDPCKMH